MIVALSGLVTGPNNECGVAGAGKDEAAKALEAAGFVIVSLADPMKRFCQEVYQFSSDQLWGPSGKRNEPDGRYPRFPHNSMYAVREVNGTRIGEYRDTEDGREFVERYLTPRHALQQLGTGWGRACYPDTWVDYALRVAKKLLDGGFAYTPQEGVRACYSGHPTEPTKLYRGVVIPDVRFVNEMSAIKGAGGVMIRIKRFFNTLPGYLAGHLSETELLGVPDDKFDHVIVNNSDVASLHQKVRVAVGLQSIAFPSVVRY
jgi:hypothetical protein